MINKRRIFAGALALGLTAAACGGSDEPEAESPAESSEETPAESGEESPAEEAAGELSGDINISGSSTVEPVSVRVQELFNDIEPNVNITVDGPGTGDGFQLFCEGETDISDASRAIKDEEAAACAEAGIEFTEIQVGIDGLSVLTSANNTAVECLSYEQIYGLVGPESSGFGNWSDANALITELGGEGNLPDAELEIYGPGEESGTFDSFIEIVLEDLADERGQEAITRPDYNPSADDNVILSGVESSDTSFGWVGYAFAENAENVTLLDVDGGDGCVTPTAETIASGEYPISRPLFIYVNNAKAAESPALQAFVDFYVADGLDTAVAEVGYVELADDAKAAVRAAWSGDAPAATEEEPMEEDAMEEEPMEEEAAADLSGLSGEITISGSSTVEPVSVRVQELFNDQAPDVNITVDGPGTGDGFQLFCEGETDISDASRAIKDEEAAACAEAGIEFTEIQVGIDGLSVLTSANNTAVECLSYEQIYGLVGPESTGFGNWSDANALVTELGGEGNLPDAELEIYGPGEESGTFDSFIEIVLEDLADERGQEAITRPDYNPSADDNVILSGVEGSDTSFGWVGFAFAENAENVTLLDVDGGDGCVTPTAETIASGEYPISRPLFIYVNNAKAAESEALQAFVDFYLADGLDQAVAEVGYVELSDSAKAEVRSGAEAI
ncbi:substrate-binding domain-containing protein [Ilumatobacter coccineus]|uniref:Phosphate ABC transporter phosphate-binding protein n=1 Tax=Ilumatobacter coccineus (strain NBRC 103263 / KCTC 29153 / YM16-304) TaxID=1313172 RepID=A0A6C7E2W2_ILUCY|nr:substrate-binding domain-containing protein [Ilumatobacter coccineus]BAN01083.1 phosphate ABC transporter phosphate-binding protein [Ilumatobacter coccineus YM16-304]